MILNEINATWKRTIRTTAIDIEYKYKTYYNAVPYPVFPLLYANK